jgi:predicted DNA-binding transcriptional regulator AlpA
MHMQSKTIEQFCDSHGISRAFWYALKKRGLTPRTFTIGGKLRRITEAAEREWIKAREAESMSAS